MTNQQLLIKWDWSDTYINTNTFNCGYPMENGRARVGMTHWDW